MPDIRLVRRCDSPVVFYVIDGHESCTAICEKLNVNASVAAVSVDDWNRDLSPWPAEKCFAKGEDFGGGAGEYIAALTGQIPEFEAQNGLSPEFRALCGYSLAGLCALYAMFETGLFRGAVSASGSMWFDGWLDYMRGRVETRRDARVYLSVGDREARTRNPRLSTVEEATRSVCLMLNSAGAKAVFELNPGNHFNEPDARLARGMNRLFEMI